MTTHAAMLDPTSERAPTARARQARPASFAGRGIPGVGVATTGFTQAAASQSKSLGFGPALVFVAHPIQDRSDDELQALADQALDKLLEALSNS